MLRIFFYTLYTAVLSTLIAAVIGVGTAFFTARRNFFGRRFLLAAGIVPLCVPPLVIALGYVSFFGVNGIVSGWIKGIVSALWGGKFDGLTFLYTTAGVVIAQGFYNFPLVTRIVNDAWERLPPQNENAARLLGAGEGRIFFTITLPRLSGAIAAACIPVFLFCFFSFMIVLLFSPPGNSTLEVELYHSVRTTLDIGSGMVLALIETFTAMGVVFAYSYVIRKNQIGVEGLSFTGVKKSCIGGQPFETRGARAVEIAGLVVLGVLALLFFVGPGAAVLISSFTIKQNNAEVFGVGLYGALFSSATFWKAFLNSLLIGLCTSALCCFISFVYSVVIRMKGKQQKVLFQLIPVLPMAVSSVVTGWILSLIFGGGNVVVLVLCQTLLFWPVGYKQIQNGMNQLTGDTQNAAFILSRGKLDCALRFYLPSCRKVMFTAFCYCFAVSIGDATLPLVLAIPNFSTLALYTYRLAGAFRFNQACACAVVMILLAGCLSFLRSGFRRNK
ncbi:MAG: iron ABC transporter permease [Treponema sp.]|nr:iron ABC transporter permease [Treponema sp.]